MKVTLKGLILLMVLSMGVLLHASVTVGTYDTGNCYPFLCNDSGTSVGPTMDYQQAYSHSAFSGAIAINDLEFAYAAQFNGSSIMINGNYNIYLGTSANAYNALNPDQTMNRGADWTLVDTLTVANGNGCNFDPVCTINLSTTFIYKPANGDLLLEVIATNQDNIPNGSGNGYMEADDTGSVTQRNYCIGGVNCANGVLSTVGLVTTFSGGVMVSPEPSSLLMFGSGILGLAGVLRRKMSL